MAPEWKEPNATWQSPEPDWDDSFDEEVPPFSYEDDEDDEVETDTNAAPPLSAKQSFAVHSAPEPFLSRLGILRNLGQQFSPILVPLLFGGLTFLFLWLLAISNRIPSLRVDHLWPVALVLLAVTVLQGTVLYYAGSNNIFWTLGIIGGFFLFLLVGCFAAFGPLPTAILLVVILIVSFVVGRLYMRPVPEGHVDIVYAFGKYSRTLYPGLNFLLPWERVDGRLHTRERQWTSPEQTVQVSRDEDVHLKATISYQLLPEDAYLAVTHVEKWEESLQNLFMACLQQITNQLTPTDILAWPQRSRSRPNTSLNVSQADAEENARWERVNSMLLQRMGDKVALWGMLINWVQIRDITLTPRGALNYDTDPMAGLHVGNGGAMPAPPQPINADSTVRIQRPPATPQSAPPVTVKAPGASRPPAPAAPPVAPAASPMSPPVVPMPGAPAKIVKEEVLINLYKQVQQGKIKSPATIRDVARRFQAIASDPEASKNVSFDAGRAAQTLFERAKLFEEQEQQARAEEEMYDDDNDAPTQADWMYSQPRGDNYTAGG